MKPIFLLLFFIKTLISSAQVFPVENLKNSSDNDKRINLVLLSDGYTNAQLPKFKTDATTFIDRMFKMPPFSNYANYFNVFIINVPSNESGADHPGTGTDVTEPAIPVKFVDTYFNATFDSFGFHRLLYYELDGNSANNTQSKITNVLINNIPDYDQAIILVNTNEYGGSGGEFIMTYTGFYGPDVAVHEIGHSLFNLKDEYFPIDDALAAEAANMTQETNPTAVRWKNWIGTNGVGVYQYDTSGLAASWYRPHQSCKMRSIEQGFCSVCKEAIVEKIHELVPAIESFTPISNSLDNSTFPINFHLGLVKPIPNTLLTKWTLNGSNFALNLDDISVSETDLISGINTLSVVVNDDTALLRIDNHETIHAYTVTWTINNTTLGVDLISEVNNFDISLYPNPSSDLINIKTKNTLNKSLKLKVISLDGKKITSKILSNIEIQQLDISKFSKGIYITNFYSENVLIASKKIVKN